MILLCNNIYSHPPRKIKKQIPTRPRFMVSILDRTAADTALDQHHKDKAFDQIIRDLDTMTPAFLQVISGEHIGRIIPITQSMTRLGLSDTACAVVVNRGKDGYFLSHLEGKVQPLVNGIPTGNSSIHLTEGALVEIDGIQMKFHKGNAVAADS